MVSARRLILCVPRVLRGGYFLFVLLVVAAAPAAAQGRRASPSSREWNLTFRPFLLFNGEAFAAQKTFDAVLGTASVRPFWGGGLQVGLLDHFFVQLNASRYGQSGQRAFVAPDGTIFPLNIPLDVSITTFEVAGAYRRPIVRRVWAYGAVGITRDAYTETSSFADAAENTDASAAGLAVLGGVEVRVHPWVSVAGEFAHTRVHGILGSGGISKDFGEDNLGGNAIRLRILVGR